jgi:flagellar protein FliS
MLMTMNRKAAANYGEVMVQTGVATSDSIELIQMLLDGLLESINLAEGHIKQKAIVEKSRHLTRASRIVIGLQGALDHEKGGDLARNLSELYAYVTRRLLHVNIHNDLAALTEVRELMVQIRDAWKMVPMLVPARGAPQRKAG